MTKPRSNQSQTKNSFKQYIKHIIKRNKQTHALKIIHKQFYKKKNLQSEKNYDAQFNM